MFWDAYIWHNIHMTKNNRRTPKKLKLPGREVLTLNKLITHFIPKHRGIVFPWHPFTWGMVVSFYVYRRATSSWVYHHWMWIGFFFFLSISKLYIQPKSLSYWAECSIIILSDHPFHTQATWVSLYSLIYFWGISLWNSCHVNNRQLVS